MTMWFFEDRKSHEIEREEIFETLKLSNQENVKCCNSDSSYYFVKQEKILIKTIHVTHDICITSEKIVVVNSSDSMKFNPSLIKTVGI